MTTNEILSNSFIERTKHLSKKTNEELIMLALSTIIPCNVNIETKALKLLLWKRSGENS